MAKTGRTEANREITQSSRKSGWPHRLKRDVPVAGLFCTSLFLTIAAAEVGLRMALPKTTIASLPHVGLSDDDQSRLTWQERRKNPSSSDTTTYPSTIDTYDARLGWVVKENVEVIHRKLGVYEVRVTTNSQGLRASPRSAPHVSDDQVSLAIFGCSQTFGETVNDNEVYTNILNREVPGIVALNFGVRGYGTDQMLLYYRERATDFDFGVVVLAFSFFHMKRNASQFLFYAKPKFGIRDGSLELLGVPVPPPEQLANQPVDETTWIIADRSVLLRWSWQVYRGFKYRRIYRKESEEWTLTTLIIREFVTDVKSNCSRVVLMNIDDEHPQMEEPLTDLARDLHVDLINMGPIFRRAARDGTEFKLRGDKHWNAVGHRIIADTIRDYLYDKKIVGPTTPVSDNSQ